MATLMPSSNVEAAYEDMFKEITRKLYGEETGNGLHTLGTPVAQVATTGPTAPEGERSFTNLQIDRTSAPTIEYEHQAGAGGVATVTAAAAAAAAAGANVVIQQQPEGSVVVATTGGNFKSEDHLSTAFGLAALMQNGFATTGTILSTQAINKVVTNVAGQQQQQQQQNANVAGDQQQQQQRWSNDGSTTGADQQQQQPQIVQWTTTGGKLQSYTTTQQQQQQQQQQITTPKSKSKHRNDHSTPINTTTEVIYSSPSTSGNNNNNVQQLQTTPTNSTNANQTVGGGGSSGGSSSRKKSNANNNNNQQNNNGGVQIVKRYACTHCPYSTDRRDLYTRHENIHKDEKPFQCYACLKQFNRADHVKKHFLRMHREMAYDINKTRRHVPNSNTHHHAGGRGNITITAIHTPSTAGSSSDGSPEQKPNIFAAANVTLDNAFLEAQRQPTSSSLSIAETIEAVATAADAPLPQMKQEKLDDGMGGVVIVSTGGINMSSGNVGGGNNGGGSIKPKREKRFTCCYCPWSGADKWGLKRHLNTHTKPFVCLLCDYKAARSERLATHVLKVHNKRACNKCSFLADTQEEYQTHINEVHPHDNRPPRNSSNSSNTNNATNNLNVLRTIGNTLVTNNQLNTFQNASTTFGVGNNTTTTTTNAVGNAGGSVTIYTTTTTNDNGSVGNIAGGPLQEIIVNPTSMVGWRLSANGSLIPPHDLLTGGLPNAAAQKRGSERLFQYLEADGSDPEDYARLLKMDAISRNTASVAQDFHKAGGVHELKLPANNQLLFNNKLPAQWTTKEAAVLLQSLSNSNNNSSSTSNMHLAYQQQQQRYKYNYGNGLLRVRQLSTGEDDENTPSSASSTTSSSGSRSPVKQQYSNKRKSHAVSPTTYGSEQQQQQRKAMTAFLSNNFELQQQTIKTERIELAANGSNNNLKREYPQLVEEHEHVAGNNNNNNNIDDLNVRVHNNNNNSDNFCNNINYEEDQENRQAQLIKSPPAYKLNTNNNTKTNINNNNNNQMKLKSQQHNRLDTNTNSRDNKENAAATFLTQMEYQNLNKISTQFQNYVKNVINKFYIEETAAAAAAGGQVCDTSAPKRMLSETEEYIEYLKNKEDITLTITPKTASATAAAPAPCSVRAMQLKSPLKRQQDLSSSKTRPSPKRVAREQHFGSSNNNNSSSSKSSRKSLSQLATLLPLLADAASQQQYLTAPLDFSKKPAAAPSISTTGATATTAAVIVPLTSTLPAVEAPDTTTHPHHHQQQQQQQQDKRSSRKQAQPKKIRAPPELVVAMLRDKYLNRMLDRKLSCRSCANSAQAQQTMLVFNYHTKGSLALHRLWKHRSRRQSCRLCGLTFKQRYSLGVHCRRVHSAAARKLGGVKKITTK